MNLTKYIEIIGIPGSGKTTAALRLVEFFSNQNINCNKRVPLKINFLKKITFIFDFLMSPILILLTIKFCFVRTAREYKKIKNVGSVIRNIKLRLLLEVVLLKKIFLKFGKVFINDEGLIGRLVVLSVLTNLSVEEGISFLKKVLPEDVVVVYIESDVDVALKRTFDRKIFLPFFHEMGMEVNKKYCIENSKIYSKYINHLKNVIVIKNDNPQIFDEATLIKMKNLINKTNG